MIAPRGDARVERDRFLPPSYTGDIDAAHERRLSRDSKLESEGRELDEEESDWPEIEDD